MKKNSLLFGILIVAASCGRYSQVRETAKKEEMKENERIYGEVDGPARQSKVTWPNPSDAAARSAEIHEIMFGKGKPKAAATEAPQDTTVKPDSTSTPVPAAG